MAYDPLSQSTRRVRTGLVVSSSAAIAIEAFDVAVSSLSIGAASLSFDAALVPFVFVAGTIYFGTLFGFYVWDDWTNRQPGTWRDILIGREEKRRQERQSGVKDQMLATLGPRPDGSWHSDHIAVADQILMPRPTIMSESEFHNRVISILKKYLRESSNGTHERLRDVAIKWHRSEARWERVFKSRLGFYALMSQVRFIGADVALPLMLGVVGIIASYGALDVAPLRSLAP